MIKNSKVRGFAVAAASLGFLAGAAIADAPIGNAATAAPVPPIGVQAGTFSYPVSCTATNVPVIGTLSGIPLSALIAGEATTSVGAGQSLYLTQGQGQVTVPGSLTGLGKVIGANYTKPTVNHLYFGVTNATPSTEDLVAAMGNGPIPVGTFPLGTDLTAGLPTAGNPDFTIGPFVAGSGSTIVASFTEIDISAPLFANATDTTPITTVGITCKPSVSSVIRSISVGGKATAAQLKPTNPVSINTSVPAGDISGALDAPDACTAPGFTSQQIGVALNGTFPFQSASNSHAFQITGAGGYLVIPPKTASYIIKNGGATISGSVTAVNLNASGATPATVNALTTPAAIPTTTLKANTQAYIPIASGLTVPSFTVGSGGATITLGSATATLKAGSKTFNISCAAPSPSAILANVVY